MDNLTKVWGFPCGSVVKNSDSEGDAGYLNLTTGLGRCPGGGNGNPLQYSCLGNFMNKEDWWATVHRVEKSWTQLSNGACTQTIS